MYVIHNNNESNVKLYCRKQIKRREIKQNNGLNNNKISPHLQYNDNNIVLMFIYFIFIVIFTN